MNCNPDSSQLEAMRIELDDKRLLVKSLQDELAVERGRRCRSEEELCAVRAALLATLRATLDEAT